MQPELKPLPYAEVAVNSPGGRIKTFSYGVPPSMCLMPGQVVWVPFGRQRVQGVVMTVGGVPEVEAVREILELLDPQPVLTKEQVALARWISDYYRCSLFDAAALMFPPGMERRTMIYLSIAYATNEPARAGQPTPKQRQVLAWIGRQTGRVSLDEVRRNLGKEAAEVIVPQLWRRRLLVRNSELQRERVRPKTVDMLSLAASLEAVQHRIEQKRTTARWQKEVALLEFLMREAKPVKGKQVREATKASLSTVRRLVEEGVLAMTTAVVSRDPLAHRRFSTVEAPTLTQAQEKVWREVEAAL